MRKLVKVTKEELHELYVVQKKNMQEIACVYDCSVCVISLRIKKYGLKPLTITKYLGNKFNKLTVIDLAYHDKINGRVIVNCICDCGNKTQVSTLSLITNNTKSCGCLNISGSKHKPIVKHASCGEINSYFWCQAKRGAKRRSIEFDLNIEDAWNLFIKQDRKCALSRIELDLGPMNQGYSEKRSASIDRIDSSKGYTIDNIQWVHKHINRMKHTFTQEYFVNICKKIAENN